MEEPQNNHSHRHHRHHHHGEKKHTPQTVDPNKKKRGPKRKTVLIVVGIILAILIAGVIGIYAYIHSVVGKTNQVPVNEDNLSVQGNYTNIINIALFGIDSNTDEGRSDADIVLTLDKTHQKVKVTSFMRDSYVNVDGYGMTKLTHAYAYGGPELAIKTLNENFGLNITDFASVNFESLPQVIDQLGGVDITITQEEVNTGSIPNITSPGTYTLNGEQALAYSRIRYASGNDFKRTERQRTVLTALMTQIVKQPTTSYPGIISQIAPLVTTSLSSDEIINLSTVYGSYAKYGIQQKRYPLDNDAQGQMIDGVYYLVYNDLNAEKQKIDTYIFQDQDSE